MVDFNGWVGDGEKGKRNKGRCFLHQPSVRCQPGERVGGQGKRPAMLGPSHTAAAVSRGVRSSASCGAPREPTKDQPLEEPFPTLQQNKGPRGNLQSPPACAVTISNDLPVRNFFSGTGDGGGRGECGLPWVTPDPLLSSPSFPFFFSSPTHPLGPPATAKKRKMCRPQAHAPPLHTQTEETMPGLGEEGGERMRRRRP